SMLEAVCVSMAWVMTNSPTRLMIWSTFSTPTRKVVLLEAVLEERAGDAEAAASFSGRAAAGLAGVAFTSVTDAASEDVEALALTTAASDWSDRIAGSEGSLTDGDEPPDWSLDTVSTLTCCSLTI